MKAFQSVDEVQCNDPIGGYRHSDRLCAELFMPDLSPVLPRWQLLHDEISVLVTDGKVWRVGDDDDSAHPCVQHITVNSDDADSVQPFRDLSPSRQADVKQCLVTDARMHCVEDRVAILEQQFAADCTDLKVRRKRTLLIVEN